MKDVRQRARFLGLDGGGHLLDRLLGFGLLAGNDLELSVDCVHPAPFFRLDGSFAAHEARHLVEHPGGLVASIAETSARREARNG